MTAPLAYAATGVLLFVLGTYGAIVRRHLVRRVLAINVAASGVFLVLVGLGARAPGGVDPVPQAMVITGIVVAVSGTALALVLVARLCRLTGRTELPGGDEG